MAYRSKSNINNVTNQLKVRTNVFLRLMTDEIVRNSDPKTPKQTGDLRRSILKQVLGTSAVVVWNKEYATRMEKIQFQNYTTPGTGPHYAENAVKAAYKDSERVARNAGLI